MFTAAASAVLLGLSAGLVPGPLMTLVIAQSLRHGPREGCKIALAPLLTDAPIIALTLALVARLAEAQKVLGALSLAGGVFVLYLAVDTFRPARVGADAPPEPPRSWLKGMLTNLLNPHPWLFWMTVGAATLARAIAESWLVAGVFLGVFYLLLVGSKVVLALIVGRSRGVLHGRPYRLILQILGALLAGFALLLFREAWRHFR
jgi:threonine/homoserine/homoserine lactone efflux protein